MLNMCRWTLILLLVYIPQAHSLNTNYYSESLHSPSTQTNPELFKKLLHENLAHCHVYQSDHKPDVILKNCPRAQKTTKHQFLSYRQARTELMGKLHLQQDGSEYFIRSLYCQKKFYKKDFSNGRGPAPGKIPDHNVMNAEHIWPQSKFSRNFPKKFQKADLHSLYPAGSVVNGKRGNLPFAEVTNVKADICSDAKLGYNNEDNRTYVEPPALVRGDIARALFYFSIRYKASIDPIQEKYLRKWHAEDPVSEIEMSKNEKVFAVQQNRNPFVDFPNWADFIQDF